MHKLGKLGKPYGVLMQWGNADVSLLEDLAVGAITGLVTALTTLLLATRFLIPNMKRLAVSWSRINLNDLLVTVHVAPWQTESRTHLKPINSLVPWRTLLDQVAFDPATLHPKAAPQIQEISLSTIIGSRARRPLALSLPALLIAPYHSMGSPIDAKLALAQISSVAGSAVVSGPGPYLPAQRAYAERWILQWHLGQPGPSREMIQLADMVEVSLGQKSRKTTPAKNHKRLPLRVKRWSAHQRPIGLGASSLPQLLSQLRRGNPDIPVGVKILSSQHLETDLAAVIQWAPDFITVTGSEAQRNSDLSDQFGIPTAIAIKRARDWIDQHAMSHISLIASGGIVSAADIVKLLALGANAVNIGPHLPWAVNQENEASLDIGQMALQGSRWFDATAKNMRVILQSLGLEDLGDLDRSVLYARTNQAAGLLGIPAAQPPSQGRLAVQLTALIDEYQRLISSLQRQVTLLQPQAKDSRHA